MSRPGFTEVARLKADHLQTVDLTRALQRNEHLLNRVKIHIIAPLQPEAAGAAMEVTR
jgi:hypothetical protein